MGWVIFSLLHSYNLLAQDFQSLLKQSTFCLETGQLLFVRNSRQYTWRNFLQFALERSGSGVMDTTLVGYLVVFLSREWHKTHAMDFVPSMLRWKIRTEALFRAAY